MTATNRVEQGNATGAFGPDTAVLELVLLLAYDDFLELERAAGAEGITTARLLRLLVRHYVGRPLGRNERCEEVSS